MPHSYQILLLQTTQGLDACVENICGELPNEVWAAIGHLAHSLDH